MLFNSQQYIVFFIAVVFAFFILPHRFRWILLLAASYYFYMCWNVKYALLMLISTLITYLSGIYLSKYEAVPARRFILAVNLFLNLFILFYFKYFNFIIASVEEFFSVAGLHVDLPYANVLLPVGISFYTFQALSYSLDVYYRKKDPERHFGIYALYVSFFPQLVAGPIERSTHLLPQFHTRKYFDYEQLRKGLLIMGWGYFNKMVIADRLAMLVNQVYNNPAQYNGLDFILATVFFSFQIFCDFYGYSLIAIGSAKILGFDLMDNFRRPYFARSISEFWRRWHISLSTWFKDYLYIPLGGNRVKESRHIFNLLVVFIISGLWHGANWTFVIWGALHGAYMVIELKLQFLIKRIGEWRIFRLSYLKHAVYILVTYSAVLFAWIFFRANSLADASLILKKMASIRLSDARQFNYLNLGLDQHDFIVALISIGILLTVQVIESRTRIYEKFFSLGAMYRWAFYVAITTVILIFGIYGDQSVKEFIYFQF